MSGYTGFIGSLNPTPLPELPSKSVSIGIAMISRKAAVVCSDSLVYLPDSSVNSLSNKTDFKKTFSAGQWIGVCVGSMDLCGNTPDTITKILQENSSLSNLLTECRKLLNKHSCPPKERHIEILLAGQDYGDPVIQRVVLHLDERQDSIKAFPLKPEVARSHVLIGEEKARNEAGRWVELIGNFERRSKTSASHLRKITTEAVARAILWSGDHPLYDGYKACGGNPISDTVRWQTKLQKMSNNDNNVLSVDFSPEEQANSRNYNDPIETIKTRRKQKHGRIR